MKREVSRHALDFVKGFDLSLGKSEGALGVIGVPPLPPLVATARWAGATWQGMVVVG